MEKSSTGTNLFNLRTLVANFRLERANLLLLVSYRQVLLSDLFALLKGPRVCEKLTRQRDSFSTYRACIVLPVNSPGNDCDRATSF